MATPTHSVPVMEDELDWSPFRVFTRESLFNIERRIKEEQEAKVSKCTKCLVHLHDFVDYHQILIQYSFPITTTQNADAMWHKKVP